MASIETKMFELNLQLIEILIEKTSKGPIDLIGLNA